jgi:hypothetical protein
MRFPSFEFSIKKNFKFEKQEKVARKGKLEFPSNEKFNDTPSSSLLFTPIHKYFMMLLNQISFFIIYFLDNYCLEIVKNYLLLPTLKVKVNILSIVFQ